MTQSEKLKQIADKYAKQGIYISNSITPEDVRMIMRDSFYEGAKTVVTDILLPMYKTAKQSISHPILESYAKGIADAIEITGFDLINLLKEK